MSDRDAGAPATESAVPSGQAVATPSSGQGTVQPPSSGQGQDVAPSPSEGQVASDPFWKITGDDGKEHVFQTPEELERHWRDGVMMQSRFTSKSQELAEQRKQFEAQQAEFQKNQSQMKKQMETIEQYRRMFRSRPEIRQALEQAAQNPRSADSSAVMSEVERLVEERLNPYEERISQFEEAENNRKQEALRQQVYGVMKNRYPDFKEDIVESSLQELSQLPEDDPQARSIKMAELLYLANRGRMSPGQRQRLEADGSGPPPPPPSGPRSTVTGSSPAKNLDEARRIAKEEDRRNRRRR